MVLTEREDRAKRDYREGGGLCGVTAGVTEDVPQQETGFDYREFLPTHRQSHTDSCSSPRLDVDTRQRCFNVTIDH